MPRHYKATTAMLRLLNMAHELAGLIAWAERKKYGREAKKFMAIQRSYESKYGAVQNKLLMLRRRFPKQYLVARFLFWVSEMTSVKPAYFRWQAAQRGK
jgi:hypothetical protein